MSGTKFAVHTHWDDDDIMVTDEVRLSLRMPWGNDTTWSGSDYFLTADEATKLGAALIVAAEKSRERQS